MIYNNPTNCHGYWFESGGFYTGKPRVDRDYHCLRVMLWLLSLVMSLETVMEKVFLPAERVNGATMSVFSEYFS